MTNPTPHGQVPEALPAIQRFEVVDCIDSKHVPAVIPKPHGPWVRDALHLVFLAIANYFCDAVTRRDTIPTCCQFVLITNLGVIAKTIVDCLRICWMVEPAIAFVC